MATGLSGSFEVTGTKNMTAKFFWSETYDVISNTHILTITKVQVKSSNWYGYTYYLGSSDRNGYIKVGSEQIVKFDNILGTHNVRPGKNSYANINAAGSYDGAPWESSAFKGNADGSCTATVSFNFSGYEIDAEGANGWKVQGSKDIPLTVIDRSAPTVSCAITVNSATGFTIKGTASVTCDIWEYSIDNGSTWTQYSTTEGASANKTLTGLTSKVYSVKVRARKKSNQVKGTSAAASADIVAPVVSLTVSNIAAHSVYIYGSADVNCNVWEYSIDNGSTWTQYSTTNGKSATKTITGLTPNTEYKIKVRAKKQSNGVKGTSAASTAKTLGGTALNSVSNFAADSISPVIQMNWTVYNASYTHKLVIKNGSTVILTIEGLTASLGTINKTYSLTAAQQTTLLKAMANLASFKATFELTSYDGTTQIGNVSSVTATISTTATNSKPTFSGFTFADVREKTLVLTENDQLLIQGQSNLRVSCGSAVAKNHATIAKYRVTIGSKTVESETTTVDFGTTSLSGSVTITVSAVDSRGYTATKTKTVTVIPFEHIRLDYWFIRRINDVEEMTNLVFDGEYSTVTINGVAKNYLDSFIYRYRKIADGEEWSAWASVALEGADGKFEYTSMEFGWFDPDYPYEIQLSVSDQLTISEIYLSLPKGTPLVAYRQKMVGINNAHPQSALDVLGDIHQNGEGVLGFVGILDADFDTVFTGGIYWYAASSALDNAPSTNNGFLLVLSFGTNIVHIFVDVATSGLMMRSYNATAEEWGLWDEK